MRVVSGSAKGRQLKSPKTAGTRPVMDRVKTALFDILAPRIAGVRFLDLFAGTGSIGIEALSWDMQGGSGCIGPHTNAHTGIHISARELARFGYLALRQGLWRGEQVLPAWWMETATRSSQGLNPAYGYTWWVNTSGSQWPGLPQEGSLGALPALRYSCSSWRCWPDGPWEH